MVVVIDLEEEEAKATAAAAKQSTTQKSSGSGVSSSKEVDKSGKAEKEEQPVQSKGEAEVKGKDHSASAAATSLKEKPPKASSKEKHPSTGTKDKTKTQGKATHKGSPSGKKQEQTSKESAKEGQKNSEKVVSPSEKSTPGHKDCSEAGEKDEKIDDKKEEKNEATVEPGPTAETPKVPEVDDGVKTRVDDKSCEENKPVISEDNATNSKEKTASVGKADKVKEKTIPPPSESAFFSSFKIPTLQTWVRNVRDRLKQKGQDDTFFKEFGKCKTDEERVSVLYNLPLVHEVLDVKECFQGKNEQEAKYLRTQGNMAFQRKEYEKALKLYSESIIKAPSEGSTELSLALANRSAVLFHLQQYVLCLQDIRQAFKHHYPTHLQYKLYERRGKACLNLRLKEEAICSFQDSLNVLDRTQLDQQKVASVKADLQKQLQRCSKVVQGSVTKTAKDFNHNHAEIPRVKGKLSTHIPCMSQSLVLKDVPGIGRGLYATRDIEVGEVLIVESPFASITLSDYSLTHCNNCCNRVYCPLPCNVCSGVVFCSEECLEAGKANHNIECKYLDLIQRSELGLGHLALRTVLKAGYTYLQEYKALKDQKASNPLLTGCNKDGVYKSNDYHSVYNLVAHTEDRSVPDLFRRALCSVFLLKCIENSDFFTVKGAGEDFDLDEEKVYIGGHILRQTQMLPCNAHEVSECSYKPFSVEMSELLEVGSAIYSTLSLINHSCDPSVVRHSYGNVCVVRAIRNIPKGKEIVDNYGALYPVITKDMRQEKLMSQYYFKCQCHACKFNWPLYHKIRKEYPILKCKKCKIGRITIPGDNQTTRAICVDCREVIDITPDLMHLSKSEEFFQGSLDKVLKGEERTEGLPFLEAHLRLIDTLLVRPWKDYNDCQEAIKQCYSTMGNCQVQHEPDEDEEELMASRPGPLV